MIGFRISVYICHDKSTKYIKYGDFAGKVDVSAKLSTIYLILAFYWQTLKHQPSVTYNIYHSKLLKNENLLKIRSVWQYIVHLIDITGFLDNCSLTSKKKLEFCIENFSEYHEFSEIGAAVFRFTALFCRINRIHPINSTKHSTLHFLSPEILLKLFMFGLKDTVPKLCYIY